MKKQMILCLLASFFSIGMIAKTVRFSVDMTGQTISPNGIHITGDFQEAAGFSGANWDCNAMTMSSSPSNPMIYELTVNIPAFQKYEYKFVNGDQCYEVEVVPEESRANFNFSDNRWIYIDSLNTDTLILPAFRFNENTANGYTLIRFKVSMANEASINPNGVHVAGSHQGWNTSIDRMYAFCCNVYEHQTYLSNTGSIEYKYYNGNSSAQSENVPGACATNGNRTINVSNDMVGNIYCFSSCNICWPTSTNDIETPINIKIYPNPSSGSVLWIDHEGALEDATLYIKDMTGRTVLKKTMYSNHESVNIQTLAGGIYSYSLYSSSKVTLNGKLLIQ